MLNHPEGSRNADLFWINESASVSQILSHTQMHAQTQRCKNTHKHSDTKTPTDADTARQIPQRRTHTHTHTQRYKSHTHTLIVSLSYFQ